MYVLVPPVIDKGPFVPRPSVIGRGNQRVKIGTPIYLRGGYELTIDCNIVNGSGPIKITWFRNGSPYSNLKNVSELTLSYLSNGDVFTCRVENNVAYDTEKTTAEVVISKCVCHVNV